MNAVNRAAFVVRFKEPYIQWAIVLNSADADLADRLRKHTSDYLVPEDTLGEEKTD